jgi:hypothetical protein
MLELPENIVDIIVDYRILFNIAIEKDIEKDIVKFINSFDDLILENITNNFNKFEFKRLKITKIIIKLYQPEYAHHIPFVDDMLYWNYQINNFKTISNFSLNRDINDQICQKFYKKEITTYYNNKANLINYVSKYD